MSLSFSSIASAISSAAAKAIADLGPLWEKLKPVVEATAEELAMASLQAVVAQIPAVASGQEKMSAASSQVVTALGAAGKTAAASLITASVQLAFNQIQAMRPVTP